MPSSLNGTGVTFNDGSTLQSGNIPAANLGSGTANSNTFLRGDRTFATPPSQAPTTAQVLSAYAGATRGAVGSYIIAFYNSAFTVSSGGTTAGSALFTVVIAGAPNSFILSRTVSAGGTIGFLSGTWRYMGQTSIRAEGTLNNDIRPAGFFLRIS